MPTVTAMKSSPASHASEGSRRNVEYRIGDNEGRDAGTGNMNNP